MAVAVDSVGPAGGAGAGHTGATALSWTHTTIGGPCLILAACAPDAVDPSLTATATCDGASMTSLGTVASGSGGTTGFLQVFSISGIAAGAHTIVVTPNASVSDTTAGSVAFTGAGGLGTPATSSTLKTATISPTASGNIIAGFFGSGDVITQAGAPATGQFINNLQGGAGSAVGNIAGATAPGTGSSVTITWVTTSTAFCSFGVEVQVPAVLTPVIDEGLTAMFPATVSDLWFPRAPGMPGGVPFQQRPVLADVSPALPYASVPDEGLTAYPVTLSDQWFPGAPGRPFGVPFGQYPAPADAITPVPPPHPPVIDEGLTAFSHPTMADWWFPGAPGMPGGIPFEGWPPPSNYVWPLAPPLITGASADKSYLVDQYGNPRLFIGDDSWSIIANGGAWNSGNYQQTFDTYLSQRAQQGYTAVEVSFASYVQSGTSFIHTDGSDWDGVYPFTSTTDPSSGFNNAFWVRRDYFITSAARNGITVVMNITTPSLWNSPNFDFGWSTAQWTAYGTGLAARYKLWPNIIWIVGDDYFGTADTGLTAMLTAMRAGGDTHLMSYQAYQEATSRYDLFSGSSIAWGLANAQMQWVYTYNFTYDGIEKAYLEASPIPVVWGDGFYLATATTGITDTDLERRFVWWALSSGARGVSTGDNDTWTWPSGAAAVITAKSFYTSVMPAIAASFKNLPGWHKLIPDTSSALVTAGRGTHGAAIASGGGGTGYTSNTDTYVTASRTPDGSLAVIYMSHPSTITIDQSKLGAGYTATWLDPANGATATATPGTTYNSGSQGSNSAADADWVLVLQGPAVSGGGTGAASVAGAGSAAAVVTQAAAASAAGAGAVLAAAVVISPAAAAGAGSAAAVATQGSPAALAGAGAAAAVVTQAAAGAAAAAAADTAAVTQAVTATAAGAGLITTAAAQAATAVAAGAGAVADVATQIAAATAAGAGSVTAAGSVSGVSSGTAAVAGAAAVTAVVTQAVIAATAGAGSVTAAAAQAATAAATAAGAAAAVVTQAAGGTLAGAGSAGPAPVTQAATAAPAGTGSATAAGSVTGSGATANITGAAAVTAVATVIAPAAGAGTGTAAATAAQITKAAAAGAGSVTAAGQITGTASVAGAGTAAAVTTQAVTAAAASAGILTALATQRATAALTAAGAVTAAGNIQLAFTVGTLTAATAAASSLTAATIPGAAAGGTLTASDQRTGGPGG